MQRENHKMLIAISEYRDQLVKRSDQVMEDSREYGITQKKYDQCNVEYSDLNDLIHRINRVMNKMITMESKNLL